MTKILIKSQLKTQLFIIILLTLNIIIYSQNLITGFATSSNQKLILDDSEKKFPSDNIITNNNLIYLVENNDLLIVSYETIIEIKSNALDVIIITEITYRNNGSIPLSTITQTISSETILSESRTSTFFISDTNGDLFFNWEISNNEQNLEISLREPLQPNEYHSITINYIIENAIYASSEIPDGYIFQWTTYDTRSVEQYKMTISLPTKFQLFNNSIISPLEPQADQISLDGQVFLWNYYNVAPGTTFNWIIRFQLQQDVIDFQYKIPAYVYGIMVVIFFVGGGIGSFISFFVVKRKLRTEKLDIVDSFLSQPEREIISVIKGEGGMITQNKICTITGFSKAKVSYYIKELENREIIQRERFGRMNRISLIENTEN